MLCVLGKLLDKFDERAWNIKTQKFGIINWDNKGSCPREGGGVTQSREAPPERGTFYQASGVWKDRDSLVVVYARVGKSIIEVLKRAINQNVSKRPRESYIILIY